MKMLVADDNADSRNLLSELMLQWGHEVTSAVLKAGRCEDLSKEKAKEQHNR